MNTKNGGQAFPFWQTPSQHGQGMTLRDYFAAKAMQGMVAGDEGFQDIGLEEGFLRMIATDAYLIADAMLAARGEA